jgi:predicted DCC family thiol-disulfide oxidoreductase YuxK
VAPGHDVILYDGACGLCRRAAGKLARSLPAETGTSSFRDPGALRRFPGLDSARCESALQLVRKDGIVFAGVEAVVQSLRRRWYGPLLRAYYLPGIHVAADALYGAVARRRFRPSREGAITAASRGRAAAPHDPAR